MHDSGIYVMMCRNKNAQKTVKGEENTCMKSNG